MNCHVDKPYPQIKVERKSLKIAQFLKHLYTSNESELTAVLQYSYESFIVENEEMRKIIRDISIVEMHHLEILGKTIQLLGEEPMFFERNYCEELYWNSDYVYYDTDLKTILEINIEQEKKAIRNYQMVLNVIDDIFVKELIKRILEDEYLHLEIFMKLQQKQY